MKLRDISKWADTQVREIEVLSNVCPVPMKLKVRRFVPMRGDSLKRGWMDGKVKKYKETEPFGIVNMSSAVKNMREYINTNVIDCLKAYAKGSDDLVRETYSFALKHMERHRVST